MAKTVKIYLDFYVFVKNLLCSHILPFDRSPEKIHRHRSSFPVKNRKKSGIKVFLDAFFLEKILWSLELQFLNPCKSFMPKVRNFRDQTQKQKKLFLKTCHLFRKIFWRQKLQFWQPSHKNARQKRKQIRQSKSENISKKVFTDPTFISAKSMQFQKSSQKIKPIVSYSSALDLKLFKKFCFLYLKILSPYKGRLFT